ncbi:MAG: HRDC domain-containing protein [Gemmatimonadota bacterium]|nr:HRDC domain-containing protein [Gemmatimonadota bacterium]MDH3422803.1 HRDC domain-containing protein [Gemmatimonadota bacterium]
MSHIHIGSPQDARTLQDDLASTRRLALDCEAAGFHRYSDRLCLLQLTTEGATYVIDPLGFDPSDLLRGPLEDPGVEVVMHGADFDLRLLRRDLGIELQGLFDTQIAAQLLGVESIGLAALLGSRLDVSLSKKYQRADWAERPLNDAMLEYAADDTRYLIQLADLLAQDLEAAGRQHWAQEECQALQLAAGSIPTEPAEPEDPVVRVKGARKLSTHQVAALRVALEWRDEIARKLDRAAFRVIGNGPLIEAVATRPLTVRELTEIKGFPARLANEEGAGLLERFDRIAASPEEELLPYPKGSGRGAGRPPPEVEALADRLKSVRNRKSDELGLPRGTLLSNAVVLEIARIAPGNLTDLSAIDGMRRWKADTVGEEFLAVIRGGA